MIQFSCVICVDLYKSDLCTSDFDKSLYFLLTDRLSIVQMENKQRVTVTQTVLL